MPAHLRTAEGVTWGEEGAIATGWVNTAKLPRRHMFTEEMRKLGLTLCSSCLASELNEDQYVFDPLCPKVVNLHEKARERLAVSQLVRSHSFVFLVSSLKALFLLLRIIYLKIDNFSVTQTQFSSFFVPPKRVGSNFFSVTFGHFGKNVNFPTRKHFPDRKFEFSRKPTPGGNVR